jgi:cyclopropane-fatty-acyl-phospholipid synthase
MRLFDLEHTSVAYRADFALYGLVSVTMALAMVFFSPPGSAPTLWFWVVGGALAWTLVEYLLHRFVLHGLPPFNAWHAKHHHRPGALIGSPTVLSVSLFLVFVALPAWLLIGEWPACALGFGLVTGYLGYGLTHHATHHVVFPALMRSDWLARRRRWHALHHVSSRRADAADPGQKKGGPYGVSCSFWDRVFGTSNAAPLARK